MRHKPIQDMTKDEYRAFVRRLEKRHGPDKTWEELPIIRRPGRPAKGSKTRPLQPRSVKLPQTVWNMLAIAAKRNDVTAIERLRKVARDGAGFPTYVSMALITESGIIAECDRIEALHVIRLLRSGNQGTSCVFGIARRRSRAFLASALPDDAARSYHFVASRISLMERMPSS